LKAQLIAKGSTERTRGLVDRVNSVRHDPEHVEKSVDLTCVTMRLDGDTTLF
jgi:hypothetical protein